MQKKELKIICDIVEEEFNAYCVFLKSLSAKKEKSVYKETIKK